ncbi:MAG: TlpA family protein disulfide reductase, partial [Muribaculaceae bacterium]|nr:TlpA family protein disulfide reductase [Muribaculaceae bacterium]
MKKFLVAIIALVMALPSLAQLPSVQLKDVDGNAVNTAELSNDGKPFVISFWATWCKPCQRELKAIHEVYPDWQDETGMKLIVVSIDEAQNAERVKTTIDGRGWEYEVVLDPNGEFKRQMGVQNP